MNLSRNLAHVMILAIVLSGLGGVGGCHTLKRASETIDSTREKSLNIDRRWDIHEEKRKFLIVMVHGFNSSGESAWGKFPSLITHEKDSTFANFNVIRYGYGSSACRNKVEISIRGDGLRSFLIDEIKNYHGIIFVSHSMGGLVVMQALTILARDKNADLERVPIVVMTFGTPHLGVQGTEVLGELGLLCKDKQAEAMEPFSESLGNLTAQWNSYFESHERSPYRYHVSLKRYYGPEDFFVSHVSACGGRIAECAQVDGNHTMIVKPDDPSHLAYQKLRAQIGSLFSVVEVMSPKGPSNLRIN